MADKLRSLGADKAVLIDKESDKMFERASQNLKKVRYYGADGLNVYDLMKYDRAVMTKDSLDAIVSKCGEAN